VVNTSDLEEKPVKVKDLIEKNLMVADKSSTCTVSGSNSYVILPLAGLHADKTLSAEKS
jgi:hypothetical protein